MLSYIFKAMIMLLIVLTGKKKHQLTILIIQ
jgi:hypothetical protein